MGFTMGGGNIGRLLVPFIIGWSNDIGMQPIIASSLFYLVFGLVPVLALKETLKTEKHQREKKKNFCCDFEPLMIRFFQTVLKINFIN